MLNEVLGVGVFFFNDLMVRLFGRRERERERERESTGRLRSRVIIWSL